MAAAVTLGVPRVAIGAMVLLAALAAFQAAASATAQLSAVEAPLLWWATRSLGFVAYLAMSLSMLFGVLITARGLDGLLARKTVLYLHQQWTLAAVVSTLLHVATVVLHKESQIGLIASTVPFASQEMTGPIALGVVGMWGLFILAVSSWLRSHIPFALWRGIHGFAFGAFLLSVLHSVLAGTDSGQPLVQWAYLATTAVVSASIVFRVLVLLGDRAKRGETSAAHR